MSNAPEHEIRREAWRSSEFWMSAAVIVLPVILPLIDEYVGKLPKESPYALIGACIVAGGYAISRGLVKASRNIASGQASALPAAVAATGDVNLNAESKPSAAPYLGGSEPAEQDLLNYGVTGKPVTKNEAEWVDGNGVRWVKAPGETLKTTEVKNEDVN